MFWKCIAFGFLRLFGEFVICSLFSKVLVFIGSLSSLSEKKGSNGKLSNLLYVLSVFTFPYFLLFCSLKNIWGTFGPLLLNFFKKKTSFQNLNVGLNREKRFCEAFPHIWLRPYFYIKLMALGKSIFWFLTSFETFWLISKTIRTFVKFSIQSVEWVLSFFLNWLWATYSTHKLRALAKSKQFLKTTILNRIILLQPEKLAL